MAYVWGVDSAAPVTEKLLQCVARNFGKPRYWGRYLTTVPRAADGLTPDEIAFLHRNGIKVLPIYNAFREAVGYQNGKNTARQAIHHAARLGIAKGTVLFANIEHYFRVNEGWIRGWTDTLRPSGFRTGIYHDPIRGAFAGAFCAAARKDRRVRDETFLWAAEPEATVTGPEQAPAYGPHRLRCGGSTYAWQYGRDSRTCPIDSNLIDTGLFRDLY